MADLPGVRVDGLSGLDIYWTLTQGAGRSSLGQVGDSWRGLAGHYTGAQTRIEQVLNAVHATWEGAGAESAQGALSPLAEWANSASQSTAVASTAIAAHGDAFSAAQYKVQPMVNIPNAPWGNGFGVVTTDHDKALAVNDARTAVNRDVLAGYGGGTSSAVTALPRFEVPVDIGTDIAPPATPSISPSDPGTSGMGGWSAPRSAYGQDPGGHSATAVEGVGPSAPGATGSAGIAGPGTPAGGQAQQGWTSAGSYPAAAQYGQPGYGAGSATGGMTPGEVTQGDMTQGDMTQGGLTQGGYSPTGTMPGYSSGDSGPGGYADGGYGSSGFPGAVRSASAVPLDGSVGPYGSGAYGPNGPGPASYGTGAYGQGGSGAVGGSAGTYGGTTAGHGEIPIGGGSYGSAGSVGAGGSGGAAGYGGSGTTGSGTGSMTPGGRSGVGASAGEPMMRGGGGVPGASAGGRTSGMGGGMGGMGAGGGRGSEDTEHEMPDFLKTEDAFGCTISYCPPVIGE